MFPVKPGTPLESVEHFVRHLGGAPANLAVGLARQGVATAQCTLVGNDAFGRFVMQALQQEGVLTDAIAAHPSARTGVTFVAIGPDGERSFLFYRHPSADMLIAPAHIDAQALHLRRGRLFHFGSSTLAREPARSATLRALECASQFRHSKLLSCDVNLRPHLWPELKEAPPLLRKLLFDCDIVKLTLEELPLLFGTDSPEVAAAQLRQKGVAVVVVTQGERGCYLDTPAGQSHFAPEPTSIVDTTGAGDAFSAGMLAELLTALAGPESLDVRQKLRGLSLAQFKRAAVRGNHLAARCCTAIGATTAIPRQAQTS